MKYIAFKRAKSNPGLQGVLPPEFITEYADTTLFPPGFHKVEEGWDNLLEDQFNEELAKNQMYLDAFNLEIQARNELRFKTNREARIRAEAEQRRETKKLEAQERQRRQIEADAAARAISDQDNGSN